MKIIFIGAPASGKGTYAKRLVKEYDLTHISTGDLIRKEIEAETQTGKQAKEYTSKGQLVPNEIIIELLKERMSKEDAKKGFILDGFPRNMKQAKELESITEIDKVLNFEATMDTIIRRITGRRICRSCGEIFHVKNIPVKDNKCTKCGGEVYQREDEKPEVVKQRLSIYETESKPLTQYYEEKGVLVNIDSNKDVSNPEFDVIDVCKEIFNRINNRINIER